MLRKTTILPTDDAPLAQKMLRQLIHEEPHVLLIVLGNDKAAELLVERADKMAGAPGEPRWIAWARDRDGVSKVLNELSMSKALREKAGNALGLVLSLSDVVRDLIPGPDAPDLFRIYKAFKKAEANRDE